MNQQVCFLIGFIGMAVVGTSLLPSAIRDAWASRGDWFLQRQVLRAVALVVIGLLGTVGMLVELLRQ